MLSPVVCLAVLLIGNLVLPDSKHPWFTPSPARLDEEDEPETKASKETHEVADA